jgi:hypothetical protein
MHRQRKSRGLDMNAPAPEKLSKRAWLVERFCLHAEMDDDESKDDDAERELNNTIHGIMKRWGREAVLANGKQRPDHMRQIAADGGRARARALSEQERREIARAGGRARALARFGREDGDRRRKG